MKTSNQMISWLRSFFINYLWLGVLLVCIAIILDIQYQAQPNRHLAISSVIFLIEAIGIAIIVAAIFTFASGTSYFMQKIRSLLQDIVVSRSFLANIDIESKKEALKALIKPSAEEQKIYSNLEDYYNKCIENTLSISQKCVRSNYCVNCVVRYDKDKGRVITRDTAIYRIYPTEDGYKEIEVKLYDYQEDFPPVCEKMMISNPNGERLNYQPLDLEKKEGGGEKFMFGKVDIGEFGHEASHLDIETTWLATEHDHWATIGFQALQPTDGFRYHLICEDDIKIRSVTVFTFGIDYKVEQSDKELIVSSSQWLHEGAGLSAVVSREINREG